MKITKRRRKRYGGSLGGDIFIFVVLVLLGLFMIFPIYLSVIQSLKPVEHEEKKSAADYEKLIAELTAKMFTAAENLEFEQAAALRDKIQKIEKEILK